MTLELRDVSKRFTGIVAVDHVSFEARAGEVTGYLGPNGFFSLASQSGMTCWGLSGAWVMCPRNRIFIRI
jgi:ABC-type lipopolysaccharide export system ATPase subunit